MAPGYPSFWFSDEEKLQWNAEGGRSVPELNCVEYNKKLRETKEELEKTKEALKKCQETRNECVISYLFKDQ